MVPKNDAKFENPKMKTHLTLLKTASTGILLLLQYQCKRDVRKQDVMKKDGMQRKCSKFVSSPHRLRRYGRVGNVNAYFPRNMYFLLLCLIAM